MFFFGALEKATACSNASTPRKRGGALWAGLAVDCNLNAAGTPPACCLRLATVSSLQCFCQPSLAASVVSAIGQVVTAAASPCQQPAAAGPGTKAPHHLPAGT
jgi:hypothetical protein